MNLFHRYDLKKSIFLIVLGWFFFSSLYALSKAIGDQTTVPTMLFFRNVLGLVGVLPWVIMRWPKSFTVKNFKVILIRSIMGLLNLCFIFLAVQKISLVNVTLLNNSAPFFVPFILWFWLKVPINHKLWPAIVLGFIGIGLILQPDKKILNIGTIWGLFSGIALAITLVTMRLASKKESLDGLILYFFFIGIIITAPFAIANWKVENGFTLVALLAVGALSALGQVCLYFALKFGKAHQLAPFTYTTVIFSGFYEWLIWDQHPKPLAYLGMILIIAAGIWVFLASSPKKLNP